MVVDPVTNSNQTIMVQLLKGKEILPIGNLLEETNPAKDHLSVQGKESLHVSSTVMDEPLVIHPICLTVSKIRNIKVDYFSHEDKKLLFYEKVVIIVHFSLVLCRDGAVGMVTWYWGHFTEIP